MEDDDEIALQSEVDILSQLDHPNAVKLIEIFDEESYIYLVLELLAGGELFDRIVAAQRFSEHHAADIMSQMLSAIKHLHGHGIVHRDLKPENFLMNDTTE